MEEDVKTPDEKDLKKEPIIVTIPYNWTDDVYFMDNNTIHNGKIIGFSCYGKFGGVFITSYDIVETVGDFGRHIEVDSEFVFPSKEELIKKILGFDYNI
jgi:hypothetical protein